ncbi:head maturation protease, ClpP-related [Carboxylicivirga linearis]|uniref:ATP-dependent Clp protease proteolytic subunit n=1 Tax=Carboxylicivirga linearis TaxID=1628157 RepID=A0ABS5K0R1_9BACT|nr:head maturation protease, ClpP-related [Carboxylicivirga linearis]MBS2100703.1 ATP-dependent Clp protease proteolytic subunit [Carboxylicivirga linearis]
MFKLEKLKDKAVLTIYGYVGGYYLDFRAVSNAIDEITQVGYNQLDFHVHTYGGSVIDGNMIYNFFAGFKGEVDIYIDGVAASMGSVIMMAGTRIHIAENGFVMIHAPSGGGSGNAKDFEQYAKLLRSMEKNFLKKLAARTGKTIDEVREWMDGTDYWFDAEECLELGLVDSVFDAKVKDIESLNKGQAADLGAKAVYDRFAALTTKKPIINKSKSEMDKAEMIKRYGLTSVTAESTDEEILAAIDAKMKAKDDAVAAERTKSIEAAVDSAIAAGKLTKEQKADYVARGEKLGLDDLNAILGDMHKPQSVTDLIKDKGAGGSGGAKPEAKGREGWTWDDYQKKASAELEAMADSSHENHETFKALYKGKYGSEPK